MIRHIRKHIFHVNTFVLLVTAGMFAAGSLIVWFALLDLPDLGGFEERIVRQSTKIYDRTGEVLLYDVHENIQRTVVAYENISRHVKNATVAIEDAEFYEHRGVKPSSTLRAIMTNIIRADVFSGQGGSTITQQVVKNSLLTPEKKISRKLKEWALALKLEQAVSKEEILTLYLNETPYGGNLYGVEEASRAFFGKSARDITIAEAAYLAALPQAPTYYSPYGEHRDALEARKNTVLARMLEEGFVTEEEFDGAMQEEVVFRPRKERGIKAPHFVFYVQEYLSEQYGPRAMYEDGLRVITTLDWELQQIAERVVNEHALSNAEQFNAENAALVATDPRTGQILVMVGSRNYFDEEIDGNFNITTAYRQPGSAFKPIVYATALEEGYTPETVVFDLRTQFSTTCASTNMTSGGSCYSPVNYDNTFRGPVTFRDALAQSVNIPAVKVLYLVGLNDALNMAERLGIRSLDENADRYGLTLVLGGGEVTPLEMASAYATFANDGVWHAPASILRVEDSDGMVIEEFSARSQQALSSRVSRQISDILTDNAARTPAFGANSYLHFAGRDVGVKTGTTDDYRDAWIIGYTPSLAAAAWAGNNGNSPMVKKVAGFIIAPLWRAFMDEALATLPHESFPPPPAPATDVPPRLRGIWQGGQTYLIDTVSGKRATERTPRETQEEVVITNVHSILHWVDKDNPFSGQPQNPYNDPQYTRWEYPVQAWAAQRGLYSGEDTPVDIPDEYDDVHTEDAELEISVSGIDEDERYTIGDTLTLRVEGDGEYPLQGIEVYLNGQYVDGDENKPFIVTVSLEEAREGENSIRVVGIDRVFNRAEETFVLTVK